jgi:hypothetical protein
MRHLTAIDPVQTFPDLIYLRAQVLKGGRRLLERPAERLVATSTFGRVRVEDRLGEATETASETC